MQPLKLRLVISKYYCCVFDSSVINFDSSAKKKCLKSLTYASLNRHLIKYSNKKLLKQYLLNNIKQIR